jgi:hypothetical protein
MWFASGCLAAAAAAFLLHPAAQEPRYNGQSLTYWLSILDDAQKPELDRKQVEKAREAVLLIGTNAFPCYFRWIKYQPHQWQNQLLSLIYQLPSYFRDRAFFRLTYSHNQLLQARRAECGFATLGRHAAPALPELIQLLNDTNSLDIASRAAIALGSIGPAGFPPLLQVLTNASHPNRRAAITPIASMGSFGVDLSPALPSIARLAQDPYGSVAMEAAAALGIMKLNPEISLPALTNTFAISSQNVRHNAIHAIREFGANARPAIPTLQAALHDPYWAVQIEASNALRQVAPELLPMPR